MEAQTPASETLSELENPIDLLSMKDKEFFAFVERRLGLKISKRKWKIVRPQVQQVLQRMKPSKNTEVLDVAADFVGKFDPKGEYDLSPLMGVLEQLGGKKLEEDEGGEEAVETMQQGMMGIVGERVNAVLNGRTVRREGEQVGRNEPCHCGSGKKYKKCHGKPKN
jgi:hypothetical protein